MGQKEVIIRGPFRFIRNPGGKVRESFVEQLLRLYGSRRYRFASEADGWALLDRQRDWLVEQGCKHLLGADGNSLWWIDIRSMKLDRQDLEMSQNESYILGSVEESDPSSEWFVVRKRRERFQTVRAKLGKLSFRFAVVRNEPSDSPQQLYSWLLEAGLEPLRGHIFSILHKASPHNNEVEEFWSDLEDLAGPIDSICAIDPETQDYFQGLTPSIWPSWQEQTFFNFALVKDAPGKDAISADLIPIA